MTKITKLAPFALMAGLMVSACSEGEPVSTPSPEEVLTEQAVEASDVSDCRNDGDRLPVSGLCRDVAIASLNVSGEALPLMEGCEWGIQETPFIDRTLLYLAAQCGETTSRLTMAVGAQTAELYIEESAVGSPLGDYPVAKILSSDPEAPLENLQAMARSAMDDQAAAELCVARPANMGGWPEDAIVVDTAHNADAESDMPRAECGPYGYSDFDFAFWRVIDDFAFFFSMGQDLYLDIDPQTLTFVDVAPQTEE